MQNNLQTVTGETNPVPENANDIIFNNETFNQISRYSEMMASAKVTVPAHLQNSPGDCMAITMQAAQWGMNPFAVAQKTHLIKGVLGYEAQLINAVVTSSTAISGRFHYKYLGEWDKIAEFAPKNGSKGWSDDHETGLCIQVGAILRGETEITWLEKLFLKTIIVRNSPLWVTDPKQQIAYLAVKRWSRLYTPAVILGVYTSDEVEASGNVKNITSQSTTDNVQDLNDKLLSPASKEPAAIESTAEPELSVAELSKMLSRVTTAAGLKNVAEKAKQLSDSDKNIFRELYKKRAAELKKSNKSNEPLSNLKNCLNELDRASNLDDLNKLAVSAAELLTPTECNEFQDRFDIRHSELKG